MAKRKKTWREKLMHDNGLPKVEKLSGPMLKRYGRGTMVVPAPREVDALMRTVPPGKVTTIPALRNVLAKRHRATLACPMTTGIFAWMSAHAAEEARAAGETDVTPYWRTLKADGELNAKYPGGLEELCRLLEEEGHKVISRGKRMFVADYEQALAPSSTTKKIGSRTR